MWGLRRNKTKDEPVRRRSFKTEIAGTSSDDRFVRLVETARASGFAAKAESRAEHAEAGGDRRAFRAAIGDQPSARA